MKFLNLGLSVVFVSLVMTSAAWAPPAAVPEPGSLTLLALGVAGLVAARRRDKQD